VDKNYTLDPRHSDSAVRRVGVLDSQSVQQVSPDVSFYSRASGLDNEEL
jgi:hypothetical protein